MKKLFVTLFVLAAAVISFAETLDVNTNKTDANIVGHIIEKSTGDHLPFVNVRVEGTPLGVVSDASGHYMLTNLPIGEYTLVFSMVGFETQYHKVTLVEDKTLEINVS